MTHNPEVVILAWDMDGSIGESVLCDALASRESVVRQQFTDYLQQNTSVFSEHTKQVIIQPATNRKDQGLEYRNILGKVRKYATSIVLEKIAVCMREMLTEAQKEDCDVVVDSIPLVQRLYSQYAGTGEIWAGSYQSLLQTLDTQARTGGKASSLVDYFDITQSHSERSIAGDMKLDILLALVWQQWGEKPIEWNFFDDRFYTDYDSDDSSPLHPVCRFLAEYPYIIPANIVMKIHKLDHFELSSFTEVWAQKQGLPLPLDSCENPQAIATWIDMTEVSWQAADEEAKKALKKRIWSHEYTIVGTSIAQESLWSKSGLGLWLDLLQPAAEAFWVYNRMQQIDSQSLVWYEMAKQKITDLLGEHLEVAREASAKKEGMHRGPSV